MLRIYVLSATLIFGAVILFALLSAAINHRPLQLDRPVSSLEI